MLTREELQEVFSSAKCWCGREKWTRHAVCGHCWRRLTLDERDSLFAVGPVLAESYERVRDVLKRRVRPAKAVPAKPSREELAAALPVAPGGRRPS